ncbi:tol-like protein [Colletotrichum asianum]|uniref:Tol-like protein n=1 Tax=Colletotrichum asianum TaxID=702518 RepID=A0A8H3WPH0_9PEZI|nr:tol-like protein [Colletotrichum asianum]
MTTRNAPNPVSYRSITRELENPPKFGKPPKDHCDPFLPESRVHTLVQRDRVESTLRAKIPALTHSDLKKLTNYVMDKASKVFLTLVRSEAVPGHLELFQSHGFTDADLPIGLNGDNGDGICSVRLDGKPKDPNGQSLDLFDNWSDATIETFFQRQWIFLAPTFRKAQFEYNFDHHCSLPFVDLQDEYPDKGAFGAVRRLGLQIECTDFLTFDKTDKSAKPYVEVAVKVLTSTPAVDVKKFYRKEMETLKVMRRLKDDHLIRAIAVYKKGRQKCFVFPWAHGGNLQDLWKRDRTKLSKELVTWAIAQMYGISSAIEKLHGSGEEGIRHGDIKPLNILHFPKYRDGSFWGTLVVADVGLAKLHKDYTDLREGTTTKHGTTMYEPPEMENFAVKTTTISRRYDVWSLGCVFLEFTIWLLYGKAGLDQFYGNLTASKTYRFWIGSPRGPILHPVVGSLIKRIKNDVKQNTALWRLAGLISSWLLIGIDEDRRMAGQPTKYTGRATALELVEELRDIRNIGSKNGSYYFDSDMETIAEQRPDPNLNIATDQGVALRSEQYVKSHGQIPARAQLGLPLLPKPGSSQQFNLLEQWIQLCNTRHQCLQTKTRPSGQMPTRLLYVGTERDPSLRLIETRDDKVSGHYVALSHCWGILNKEQRVCTYAGNIETFKKTIPLKTLPSTFQDAVTVTRALGVSYLWIDSLCIIQEDDEDWKSEAARMEDVFSSAYCTIAASSSTSSLDGFIAKRAQRAAIGIQTSQGTLYLAEAIDDFKTHVEKGVLNTRGWVLQERALSRRTIHFTSTQMYWECGEGVHCETLAELGNRQSMFLGDSNFPTYGLEYYRDERIRLVQYFYQVYSGLSLTKSYDRSKAILGLQKRLGSTFKSTAMYGVISKYFERTFMWQADVPGSLSQIDYQSSQTVPSWSWMAVMGRIRYMNIPFGEVTWTGDLENPFQPGFDDAKWDGRLVAKAKGLAIDDGEFEERCTVDLSLYKFEPSRWKCVVVGESKVANEDGDKNQYVLLIRERSSGVTTPIYERVGVGILFQTQVAVETTIVHIV